MKLTRMRLLSLGAAVLLPFAAHAQTDPTALPPNPSGMNPPNATTNQSTPGLSRANSSAIAPDSSMNNAAGGDAQVLRDKMFLRKAGQGGLAEVQLGQLAAQKSTSEDIKKFGQKMVDDHTILNDQMKPIAQSMGIATPSKLSKGDQQEYDKLNGLSGMDFDKEYLTFMTRDHEKDLRDFQTEAAATSDPTLKDAVSNAQAVIARHLRWVQKLDSANGVPTTVASK